MSLTNTVKVDTNQYELEIAVEKDIFAKAVQRAYKKNVSKMNVPGFRRGHAPRSVVEKLYGQGIFFEDAVNELYPQEYEKAVKESGLHPVDQADVHIEKVDENGFTFKAKVTVKPEAEIGEYKGLKATKYIEKVTDEEIDDELKRVQDRNARIITVDDRAAQLEDIATIDFEGFMDDKPFEGGKAEKQPLKLGSGQFIPGFEEQIVGHKTGDSFDVNVSFPEDYQEKSLAGKPAVFKVTLHEIKNRELPALDDEFAKDVSEFDTLAEYREDVRKHLQEHKDEHAAADAEDDIMDQVVAGLKAEIPEVMYERSIDGFVQDFDYRLQSQGMNLQTYLQYTGMKMEDFRTKFRQDAERQVKLRLALEKVADTEKLAATDVDVEAEYKRISDEYKVDLDKVKTMLDKDSVMEDYRVNQAIDLIKEAAEIAEKEGPNPKHQQPEESAADEKKKTDSKKTTKTKKAAKEEKADTEKAPKEKKATKKHKAKSTSKAEKEKTE
ncbi:MAG TPA: trigger factor [Ruminococcaceae bacterium]|nr:trigger factor [Oscillospiraceae bacterium]